MKHVFMVVSDRNGIKLERCIHCPAERRTRVGVSGVPLFEWRQSERFAWSTLRNLDAAIVRCSPKCERPGHVYKKGSQIRPVPIRRDDGELVYITTKQLAVLQFIATRIAEVGYAPTVREMRDHVGYSSTNATSDLLRALLAAGLIESCRGRSRAIRLRAAARAVFVAAEPVGPVEPCAWTPDLLPAFVTTVAGHRLQKVAFG